MDRVRKYIKRSPDGRFILYKSNPESYNIDLEKKTKLWISSNYLYNELYLDNPDNAKKELEELIRHNENKQNFENCVILASMYMK